MCGGVRVGEVISEECDELHYCCHCVCVPVKGVGVEGGGGGGGGGEGGGGGGEGERGIIKEGKG